MISLGEETIIIFERAKISEINGIHTKYLLD